MNLLSTVKTLLKGNKNLRTSDKELIWGYWTMQGLARGGSISYTDFMKAESGDAITRARRKLQEVDETLRPDNNVYKGRKNSAKIPDEVKKVAVFDDVTNSVRFL